MDVSTLRLWLRIHFETLCKCDDEAAAATPAARAAGFAKRIDLVCEWAGAARLLQSAEADLLPALLAHIDGRVTLYPPARLAPLVRALGHELAAAMPVDLPLLQRVRAALQTLAEGPERAAEDHGMRGSEWTCHCADCRPVIAWAESATKQPLVLPMAEARRRHVEQSLQAAGVPIGTATIRQGSPHKLQLSKPGDLHARDRAAREAAARELKALAHEGKGNCPDTPLNDTDRAACNT